MMSVARRHARRRREDAMARSPASGARSLAADIQEHRIYFEAQRETAQRGEARVTVAVQIWLWATVPSRAGSLPGEPGCRAAVAALQEAAAAAIAHAAVTPPPVVEPFRWRLYASRLVPGADELRLELTLPAPPDGGADERAAHRERDLAELRRALDGLGILEGTWRPSSVA
jgi:hypothetical protein